MKKYIFCFIAIANMICAQSITDSLKVYYPFSGNTNDESGNGFNATNYGATPAADRYDSLNNAYSFNGSTNYMMIGNPVPSELQIQNEITLSAWIYITSYPGSSNLGLIVGSQTDYTTSGASIFIDGRTNSDGQPCPPGHIHFQIGDGSWHVTNSSSVVPLNQWVLITATRKANEAGKIYYNNVLQPSTSVSWNGTVTYNSAWMMMGRQQDYGDRYFNGKIDEARVYNRALSETEVKILYANYLPPSGLSGRAEEGRNVLSWDMSGYADLQKVKIYRNSVFYDEISVNGEEDSLYFDRHVVPGTNYSYTISSVDVYAKESIQTGEVVVTAINITFSAMSMGLPMVGDGGSAAWGDYDNDGDLDILLAGFVDQTGDIANIYRNDGGFFNDINAGLNRVSYGSAAWGDYDVDGDLDLLIVGYISKIYRNDAGVFININAGLPNNVWASTVAWGDYDNDGDLDILLTGSIGSEYLTRIYRNDSGVFIDINARLTCVANGAAAWGDYDNDGDLDILLSGDSGIGYISIIYSNNNGIFTDINAGLTGAGFCSVAWGDYDNDGDLDILIGGEIPVIYGNDAGIFTDINAGFTLNSWCSPYWGDYDNDGDLDVLVIGSSVSTIYRNDGGVFTDINAGLPAATPVNSAALGDYDNDGDLDLVITGRSGLGDFSNLYRNNNAVSNTTPSAPDISSFLVSDSQTTFYWSRASDSETPQNGLTYNIDLVYDGTNVISSMADINSGYRKIVAMGNTGHNLSYGFKSLKTLLPQEESKNILCRIQSVDNCFAGSEFSTVADSTLSSRDLKLITLNEMEAGDALIWECAFQDSIINYLLQFDDDMNFSDPLEQEVSLSKNRSSDKDLITYFTIRLNELSFFDSLASNIRYYWRVKPNYIYRTGRYPAEPSSFIYNPTYPAPSPVSISVDGNYVTLEWGTGKEAEKGTVYNVYSSDDPHAVFPSGWTLVNSVTGTSYVLNSTVKKKFYCVTAAGSVK